jgi:hypothetical protein
VADELRAKNASLRKKVNAILEQHLELRDATEDLAWE